jgi:selenocysteine lyase/cysteine desulfurase
VFGTANFLNVMPWVTSLEYLLEHGIEEIAAHDQALVDGLLSGLDGADYCFVSPTAPDDRAAIVVISASDGSRNANVHERLREARIDVALRAGNLRISPDLYNTADEIERAVRVLQASS